MSSLVSVDNLMLGPFTKFSIEIPLNSLVFVTGSNNSGKSLLLKVLAGLVNVKNKITYDKEIIKSDNDISYMASLTFNYDTVLKNIRYNVERLGYDDDKINVLVRDIAKDLHITNLLNKNIKDLNEYEKLRICLASKIVSNPKLLLLDDPCLFLSPIEKEEFMGFLEQLRTRGITIIISTSTLEEVIYTINSIIYVLDKGEIVSSGEMLEVLSNDSLLNKIGLELPFMVDLSVKLEYYNLTDKINMSPLGMVESLWK